MKEYTLNPNQKPDFGTGTRPPWYPIRVPPMWRLRPGLRHHTWFSTAGMRQPFLGWSLEGIIFGAVPCAYILVFSENEKSILPICLLNKACHDHATGRISADTLQVGVHGRRFGIPACVASARSQAHRLSYIPLSRGIGLC